MPDFVFSLVIGGCIGYGVRSYMSYCRRMALRRRFGLT